MLNTNRNSKKYNIFGGSYWVDLCEKKENTLSKLEILRNEETNDYELLQTTLIFLK
jgi:hypothetical protein